MDLNTLAETIAKREGRAKQINIAQVKEVVRIMGDILAEQNIFRAIRLVMKMRNGGLSRRWVRK